MHPSNHESGLFLEPQEVELLTGYKLSGRQIAWLSSKGWRFEINGNRRPIVARKYVEKMLGCGAPEQPAYTPNFAALQGM